MNLSDFKERRLMLEFLYKSGWLPSKNELMNVIQEYQLESSFELFKELRSESSGDAVLEDSTSPKKAELEAEKDLSKSREQEQR